MDYTKAKDFVYAQNLLQSQLGVVNGNITNFFDKLSFMLHKNYSTMNGNFDVIEKDIKAVYGESSETTTALLNEIAQLTADRDAIVTNLDTLACDVYDWATETSNDDEANN